MPISAPVAASTGTERATSAPLSAPAPWKVRAGPATPLGWMGLVVLFHQPAQRWKQGRERWSHQSYILFLPFRGIFSTCGIKGLAGRLDIELVENTRITATPTKRFGFQELVSKMRNSQRRANVARCTPVRGWYLVEGQGTQLGPQ